MKTRDKTTIQLTADLHIEVERCIYQPHNGEVWVALTTPNRTYRGSWSDGEIDVAEGIAIKQLKREFNRWLMSSTIDKTDPHGDAASRV